MESLKKFSEDIAVAKIRKEKLQKIMGQVKLECKNVEDHSRMMKDLFTKYSCEKEQTMQERQNNLNSRERILEVREKEVDSREKMLVGRENEADEKERALQERQNKLDSRERISEVREKEVDSKVKNLARREKEGRESIQSRGRLLETREKEMDSALETIERKEFELLKKEDEFVNHVKETELKQRFSDLRLKLDSRKKSLYHAQESGSKSRRKRWMNTDADQWMNTDGRGSKKAKGIF